MQGRLGLRRNRHRDLPKAEVSVGVADTALAGGRRTSRQLRGLFSQHLPSPNHLLPQVAAVCDGSCFSLRLFSWVLANCLEPDKVPRKQSVPWGPSGVEGSVYVTPARTAVGSQALTRAALPGLRRCRPGSPFCRVPPAEGEESPRGRNASQEVWEAAPPEWVGDFVATRQTFVNSSVACLLKAQWHSDRR